jgi:hypothetical protein
MRRALLNRLIVIEPLWPRYRAEAEEPEEEAL